MLLNPKLQNMTQFMMTFATTMSGQSRPNPAILQRIVDAHCHPTDKPIPSGTVDGLNMHLCIMATREDDQSKVADLAAQASTKITPAFGELWTYLHPRPDYNNARGA